MNKPLILIVEDDPPIRNLITTTLKTNDYRYLVAANGETAILEASSHNPDIVLLDLGLPGTDGMTLCREIRKVSDLPVIIITSKDTEITELMSMNYGADDFVAKPIRPQLLIAHMEAVFKRVYKGGQDRVCLDGFEFSVSTGILSAGEKKEELTRNELRILQTLAQRRGSIVTREELMNALWDNYLFVDDNTLTVNMTILRGKLENIGIFDRIITKRGMGYQLL